MNGNRTSKQVGLIKEENYVDGSQPLMMMMMMMMTTIKDLSRVLEADKTDQLSNTTELR